MIFITARIRRMGKVMFSQVCVCSQGGTPVPGSFQGVWSQVLSWGVPQSWPGRYPSAGWGYPTPDGITTVQMGVQHSQTGVRYPGQGYPHPEQD